MPKAAARTSGAKASTSRSEPYTKSSPRNTKAKSDKENIDPNADSSKKPKANKQPEADRGDYRDIVLEEIKGEIPCYDNAATVRCKLKKLLSDKSTIPGSNKKWSQTSMVGEMQELEDRGPSVAYNKNATGLSPRSLGNFLRKSGEMGAGDSPCYYWGYVLLVKLRIYNNEKKSKARGKAEQE